MKLIFVSLLLFCFVAGIGQFNQLTIHFDYNKYSITPPASASIDSFLSAFKLADIEQISLHGHCDSIGNDTYNDQLSLNRVNAVKEYFINHNIPATLFKEEKGFGKRQPLNDNKDAAARSLNRRVEIVLKTKLVVVEKVQEMVNPKPIKVEKTLQQNIVDTATKTGTKIVLKSMNFIGGRHVLLPESIPMLLELLKVLQDNPDLQIEIDGHICCTFGAEDGIDLDTGTPNLSVNRAKAVYEYLIGHGIKKHRLSYKGFGHSMPLVYPEDTELRKTTNRRVEIKILRK
jgi:outer membrane protein OmpA-like peptidoglycan-associated protein